MTPKPCPWCRGEAASWLVKHGEGRGTWSVGCMNGECGIEPAQNDFVSQEDADSAWNTRVVDAENERLRGVIDGIRLLAKYANFTEASSTLDKIERKCREALEGTK